jgi:hypothetical protein
MFLDIIHHPVFIWKHCPLYITKHNVLETGFCLRLQVKPTQLGSIDRASLDIGTSFIDSVQLSGFYLKMKTESSLWNVFCNINRTVFFDKDRTMDNVQKHNICIVVPSSKTFRSYSVIYISSCAKISHLSYTSKQWVFMYEIHVKSEKTLE